MGADIGRVVRLEMGQKAAAAVKRLIPMAMPIGGAIRQSAGSAFALGFRYKPFYCNAIDGCLAVFVALKENLPLSSA